MPILSLLKIMNDPNAGKVLGDLILKLINERSSELPIVAGLPKP